MKYTFRIFISILITSALLIFASVVFSQEIKKVKIEEVEEYIKKSDHPLVISFWATWCVPCVHEIPWLQSAVEKHKDKNAELVLISLDFENDFPKKIVDFVRKQGYKASFFWLNETDADHFCPKIDAKWSGGIPASLLINNKTGYRKFFQRQLTDVQVDLEIKKLVKE